MKSLIPLPPQEPSVNPLITAVTKDHIVDRARALAEDVIRVHELSFRMGTGHSLEGEHRELQRIIAEAEALMRTIELAEDDEIKGLMKP